jgi:cell division protein FtsX
MKLNILRTLIKEELNKVLTEEYQDKFKITGKLITNINIRAQKEVYSDIRAIAGIAVISSREPLDYSEQDPLKFQTILTVKIDGYPWITKGGFNKDKAQEIINQIKKVPGVISFIYNPEEIANI